MAFFCTLKQALTIQTEVNCKTFIKKREEGAIEIRMLIIKMYTEGVNRAQVGVPQVHGRKCGCWWMKAGYREKEVGLQGQEEPAGVDTERPLFLHSAEPLKAPLSPPHPPLSSSSTLPALSRTGPLYQPGSPPAC